MPSPHGHADRGAAFFALGAGATGFLLLLIALILLGFAAGYEPLEIPFILDSRPHLTWWEIVSFLASLGLSVSTAKFVYRRCKRYIHEGNPRL